MTTMRQLAGSLQIGFKKIDDDADIKFNQIVFWATFFVNKYKTVKANQVDSGLYLSIFPEVAVGTFATHAVNEVMGRKYLQLPATILDLDGDKGVDYISYQDKEGACGPSMAYVKFSRTTPSTMKRIFMSDYEKPSPSNPYFYRVANYIYLLGIDCISVPYVEMGLLTTFDPFSDCLLDADLGVGEDVIADIYKNVLELGRFVMNVPSASLNDGTDNTTTDAAPKQRVVSVNQDIQEE
jgi:hypothetical protein